MMALAYTFGGQKYEISRESIVTAMKAFDRNHYGKARRNRGTKYFVWWQHRSYPPKDILRCLKDGPMGRFNGGRPTNQVFRDLEFYVGKKDRFPKRQPATNTALPTVRTLKRRIFTQRWAKFKNNFLTGDTGKYPGVYLFAFSNRNLNHKPIELSDIFYVGSSCTGLNNRLNQFESGTRRNCCHSAAKRFYKRWQPRLRLAPSRAKPSFYAAVVTIPCETRKEIRTEMDIRKMGRVAELEYAVLAYIKKRTDFEPLLNRK